MSTLRFWSKAAKGIYDQCVLGSYAPFTLKRFLKEEDKRLSEILEGYVEKGEDTLFLEVGSGTGRYLRYFGNKIMKDSDFRRHLKYVVGVDFSKSMIKTSIRNLISSRRVGNRKVLSLAHELANHMDVSVDTITRELTSRIILINADAAKPFIRIKGRKVVIGIMFGTLGNISADRRDSALENIRREIPNGDLVITVFNRRKMETGWQVYRKLAKAGFDQLAPLVTHNAKFTTPGGFYSEWFMRGDFARLLKKNFGDQRARIDPFQYGLFGRVKLDGGILNHKFTLRLLCPKCGNDLTKLPLTSVANLTCNSCASSYKVENYLGFRIPILT